MANWSGNSPPKMSLDGEWESAARPSERSCENLPTAILSPGAAATGRQGEDRDYYPDAETTPRAKHVE